jgi:hypothetical protein
MRRLRLHHPHLILFTYGIVLLCTLLVVGGLPRL